MLQWIKINFYFMKNTSEINIPENISETITDEEIELLFDWHWKLLNKFGITEKNIKTNLNILMCQVGWDEKSKFLVLNWEKYRFLDRKKENIRPFCRKKLMDALITIE